jgi:oxygen-independent coproporphyrinogen-3 oxidase
MRTFPAPLPLSLYIHLPWCVQKCPYCDFNSHEAKGTLPEELYVQALLSELQSRLSLVQNRSIISIFFGGGTPSLFSPASIGQVLDGVAKQLSLDSAIEITMEANPGTIDQVRFKDFYQAGVNRLSLGIQSLQNDKLKTLGRIHDREHALRAIDIARAAGFTNFNLDLMYGLPSQTIDDAVSDIQTALSYEPTHFSWYQLTIEPNTLFYHQTPPLPADDLIWEMQLAGQEALRSAGLNQYEVSAYSQPGRECLHNLNYWNFGDYLGIGAGAHSKMTDHSTGEVLRFAQVRHPRDYLLAEKRLALITKSVPVTDLAFEFMLNALRLTAGIPAALFTERTGLPLQQIQLRLDTAKTRGLLEDQADWIRPSDLGKRYLNNLMGLFL